MTPVYRHSLIGLARTRMLWPIAVLYICLVLVSAYLGWSATHTVQSIYMDAVQYFQGLGQTPPDNPVLQTSPLALMRNMATYVSLIGVLAAILSGHQLIAQDKKAGTVPLIFSHPIAWFDLARGKIAALAMVLLGLTVISAVIGGATLLILPSVQMTILKWFQFIGFIGLAWIYMMIFGLIAIAFAARFTSQSAALLAPVVIWLVLTFVFPEITGNIHPTAAINPISALAPTPDSTFFHISAATLGNFSLAEAFVHQSAAWLDFLPDGRAFRAFLPPLMMILIAFCSAIASVFVALKTMPKTNGDFDV